MSETIEILRKGSESVDSVDVERSLDFELNQTSALLADNEIKSTLDINEQYVKERNACNDYRLIVTIKPYCTNVLFNACTEAVLYEGSDNADAVLYNDEMDIETINRIRNKVRGKISPSVGISDMIRNTEYSKDDVGFEYHPGLDIFNNHILRNKTYRIVNDYTGNGNRDIFNTIEDIMRHADGSALKRCCRKDITDNEMKDKHLYDKDDILPFYTGEAISENLREVDGWFGFYNTSIIPAKNISGVDMDISRVINSKGNCEFVDMYPDRTLFSFVPKYNPYRNRLEYNWDYALTYAFDSTTQYYTNTSGGGHEAHDFEIIQDGSVNGIATITVEYRRLPNGSGAVFFRSATKHNLKPNDKVHIYFNLDENGADWHKSNGSYIVAGVGDINHKHKDYYFYVTNLDLLEEIFCTPYLCDIEPQVVNRSYDSWDYIRDYFYKEYTETDIPESRFVEYPPQTAQRYNVGDKIYSGWIYYTKNGSTYTKNTASQTITVTEGNEYYYKNGGGGLTNIPNDGDAYIKVKNLEDSQAKRYILFNHDRDIVYDETQYDCNTFIEAIINNTFTSNDEYTNTNTNEEVNESMLGLFSDYIAIRFVKTDGNYDCSYYVRKFKQIPDPNIIFKNTIISNSVDTTPIGVEWVTGEFDYALYSDNDKIEPGNEYFLYNATTDAYTRYIAYQYITVPEDNTTYYYKRYYTITGTKECDETTYNTLYLVPRIGDNGNIDYSQYITVKNIINGQPQYRWEKRAMTLDNESYPLAFSNTIYGDKVAQSVFTDSINVTGLKDNLGRDLSEVFLTIVKSNRGYKKWYNIDNDDSSGDHNIFNDPDIEYSHCFGAVTCGFDISKQSDDILNVREIRKNLKDVTTFGIGRTIPNDEVFDGFTTEDINITDSWFYGDIVELCPWTCIETPISDVCFRFNTAQREHAENSGGSIFQFDEILSDDYDDDGFKLCKYNVLYVATRQEGYYYKAHYRIPLKNLSPVIQGSHPYISVLSATPVQIDNIYILVRTKLKHNLTVDSKVLLRDTKSQNTPEWWLDVVHIADNYTFVMKKVEKTDANYRDWIAICKGLNDNSYTLRAQNMNIPTKASRLGINTYLWRNTVDITDINNTDSETNNYVFANNSLYIDKCFNFYLRRQDPYNVNGLYFDGSDTMIQCTNSTEDKCLPMNTIDKWFLGDIQSKSEKEDSVYDYNEVDYEAQC